MNKNKIILGNWKMNPETEEEALVLAENLATGLKDRKHKVEVGVAPPFVFLEKVSYKLEKSDVLLGAQDVFWEDKGAYTGEVSAEELKSIGVDFVIVGHSERRRLGETNEEINRKVRKSLNSGLRTVLCVGEPKEIRGKGSDVAKRFISAQLDKGLEKTRTALSKKPGLILIAYEPLWAISSEEGSEPASPEKAAEIISFIKKFLEINDIGESGGTRVLYGGSVNANNTKSFLVRREIDGFLVGGASLDSEEFVSIIKNST